MICPNCGKSVTAEQELCPHCGKPTQFSSRMRYYPRATPLDPPDTKPAPAPSPSPQPSPAVIKLDPADRKQILDGLEKVADKKTVFRIKNSLTLLVLGVGLLLLLATVLINLLFMRSSRTTASAATADINDLYTKIDSMDKTISTMQEELEASLSTNAAEIIDNISTSTAEENVLVLLYCNGPSDSTSVPVCFTMQVGEQFLLPELYGKDLIFLGWSKEQEGKTDIVKAGQSITITGAVSFYAKWEPVISPSPMPTATPTPTLVPESSAEEEPVNSSPTPTATPRRRWP